MTPAISVIIGIYNCELTLQEALDSLYAQTFQDFEIILCDDGSKDNSYRIASENAASHNNIVLIKNEHNLGLNATLNNCLAVAQGRYIARMDGDDISLPERFKKEYDFLEGHPQYAIVSTPMIRFDEDGIYKIDKVSPREPDINNFSKGTPFCHAPCMVRREAYEAVGGYTVSDRLLRVEDYHLWVKMYAKGYKGFVLEEPLYMMRDDRNAVVRRNFKNRRNEAYVRYLACKTFKLPIKSYLYIARPILVGLLPRRVYTFLHKL